MRFKILPVSIMVSVLTVFSNSYINAEDAIYNRGGGGNVITSIPRTMAFQGTLNDNLGEPVTDTLGITFRIYESETGGSAVWTELNSSVSIIGGNFTSILGQTSPLNLSFDSECWVSLQVDGDPEMSPRLKLQMNPYAARADTADYALVSLPDND